jgi:hypothetical protein
MLRCPCRLGLLRAVIPAVLLIGCRPPGPLPSVNDTAATQVRIPLAGEVGPVAFSSDGKILATVDGARSAGGKVRLRDLPTGRELSEGEAADGAPRFAAFSPNGRRLAVVGDFLELDRPPFTIHLWDVTADGQLQHARTLEPDAPYTGTTVYGVTFTPDGDTLAAGTAREVIYLWDPASGRLLRRFQGGVTAGFSPDGRTLIAVTHDGEVRRFDTATWEFRAPAKPIRRSDFLYVTHAVFAPDGRRVALGDGWTTLVKDVESNRTLCRLNVGGWAIPISFSCDSKIVAVGGDEGTHLFDAATGEFRAWLAPSDGLARFLGDGKHLACRAADSITLRDVDAVLAAADKPPPPAGTDPPGGSLQAELVANRDTYTLDLEGDTLEDFSSRIQFGEDFPEPPQVDLVLRLRNTGRDPITLRDPKELPTLYLAGAGALNQPRGSYQTCIGGPAPEPVTLAPGETHTIPVPQLTGFVRAFWLLPGEYLIAGDYLAVVSPAPVGSRDVVDGFGYVAIRVAPVKVKVLAGTDPPASHPGEEPHEVRRPPAPGTVIIPKPDDGSREIRDLLSRPVALRQGVAVGTRLQEIVQFLHDRYDVDIRIDEKAFLASGNPRIGESRPGLPPLVNVSLSAVLQVLLHQVDAAMEIRGGTAWIVPQARPQSLAERLPRARKYFKDRLGKPVTLRQGIEAGTSLADALQLFRDRYEVNVVVDTRAFERAGIKDIDKQPVKLAAQMEVPLSAVLGQLLAQAGATFVPRDEMVVVIPADGK